jgi:hypothetical protein
MWSLLESRAALKHNRTRVRPAQQLPQRAPIYPDGVYSYFDKIQVWFQEPLSTRQRNRLNNWCALYPLEKPTKYWWPYSEGFQIKQPMKDDVLPWLGSVDNNSVLFNALEVALDWTFDEASDRDHADEFFDNYAVKKWHGKRRVRFNEDTRYTGPQGAPNLIVSYPDKVCRVTGELFCLHIEWRTNGMSALRRAGITLADLRSFDHRAFWPKRLYMASVDPSKLGRQPCNALRQTRRREWQADNGWSSVDYHLRTGNIMVQRLENRSTQAVLDAYGTKYPSRRWLVPFKVSHLLPTAE